MPTRARLEEIAAENLAEDLPIDDEMLEWSEDAAIKYMESGGTIRPIPAAPTMTTTPPARVASVVIGGVSLPVRTRVDAPECVPFLPRAESGSVDGGIVMPETKAVLDTARWMQDPASPG